MPEAEAARTLLVVDASFDLGNAIAVAALEHGWEPFLAGNAEAALSILRSPPAVTRPPTATPSSAPTP